MKEDGLIERLKFLKNCVLAETPENFGSIIIEKYRYSLTDNELEMGINAFRMFFYKLFNKIIDGDEKLLVKKKRTFSIDLNTLAWVLYRIGQMLSLETKPSKQLVGNFEQGYHFDNNQYFMNLYQFFTELGFHFTNINFSEKDHFHIKNPVVIEHDNDAVILGLKLMADSLDNVKSNSMKPHNVIMRGDFYPLANSKPEAQIIYLYDFIRSLSSRIATSLLEIDKLLIGSYCKVEGKKDNFSTDTNFTYNIKKGRTKVEVCKIFINVDGASVILDENIYTLDEKMEFNLLKEKIEIKLKTAT